MYMSNVFIEFYNKFILLSFDFTHKRFQPTSTRDPLYVQGGEYPRTFITSSTSHFVPVGVVKSSPRVKLLSWARDYKESKGFEPKRGASKWGCTD